MAGPPVQTWQAGDVVGRYSLVRELARGGMGVIWLAHDGRGKELVLKRLLTSSEDVESVKMFLDEARIAAMLHHPNVIEVFELGEDPGSVYLVMEYVRGHTISALMKKVVTGGGRLPETVAATIALGAARGLGSAHRCTDAAGKKLGIVHRDVSPQNVLLTLDGSVKVFDFGIARAEGRLVKTATGIVKGKVAYMSPEQASGGVLPVTAATDVYALGLVLFEMLTSTRYWNTRDELQIIRRLAMQPEPEWPSRRAPVDPALENVLMRALSTDVTARYADGQVFAEALEGWLREHPAPAGTPTLREVMHQHFGGDAAPLEPAKKLSVITEQVSPASLPMAVSQRPTLLHTADEPKQVATIVVPPPVAPAPRSGRPMLELVGAGVALLALGIGIGFAMRSNNAEPPPAPAPAVAVAVPVTPPKDAGPPAPEPLDPVDVARATPLDDEPPPPPTPEPARPTATAAATGKLSLDTNPWTVVFLGKRSLGETPLVEVPLPVGTHSLRLVNKGEKIDRRVEVIVKPRQTTVKKLSF